MKSPEDGAKKKPSLLVLLGTHQKIAGLVVIGSLLGIPITLLEYSKFFLPASSTAVQSRTGDGPREMLVHEGSSWDEASVTNAIRQKDSAILTLYFDGGWKLNGSQFYIFSHTYFDPASASHVTQRNIRDLIGSCSWPDIVEAGPSHYIFPETTAWKSPGYYESIKRSGSHSQIDFIIKFCGQPAIIAKIDMFSVVIHSERLQQDTLAYIARWREVRAFLTGTRPDW